MLALMLVILPFVTPLLKLDPLSGQGLLDDADVFAVKTRPPGPVQLLNVTEVIFPSGLLRPLPLFSFALVAEDAQVRVVPVLVSRRVVLPALPVTAPPGLTVQVILAVVADDDVAPRVNDRAAAAPPAIMIAPMRLSM